MNERLTPEEIKLASKYIKRYERDAKVMKRKEEEYLDARP